MGDILSPTAQSLESVVAIESPEMRYFYLHGFASGPKSFKAQEIADRFAQQNIAIEIPDFNEGGFADLTLTRQIQQVERAISQTPNTPIAIIGSSFGGLTALWVAERCPQVEKLVLLAPALGFPESWYQRLSADQLAHWHETGELMVYHYGEGRSLPLKLSFWEDAQRYRLQHLRRSLPTVILHGRADETVSIDLSRQWVLDHPWCNLIELDTDHSMGDAIDPIWQAILNP